MENYTERASIVAKPAHLTTGNSIFFINSNREVSIPTPTGPGLLVMKDRLNETIGPIDLDQVTQALSDAQYKIAGKNECRALRTAQPGVLLEQKINHDFELRVVTIFGKVVCAGTDQKIFIKAKTNEVYRVENDGRAVPIKHNILSMGLWERVKMWTENVAKGTDYLRVDYFVDADCTFAVANEMNAFPWPSSRFFMTEMWELYVQYVNQLVTYREKF